MRISSLVLILAPVCLLAACSEAVPYRAAGDGEDSIDCALAGATKFEAVCAVERAAGDGKRLLIVRHPDGGFRRFEIVSDGRGLVVADGAEEASVSVLEQNRIEVSVAGDRYRLPATVAAKAE